MAVDLTDRERVDPAGVRAHATIVAEVVAGRTAYTTLRSSPPVALRATPEGVYLVGTLGGPLGGDELTLDATVKAGGRLELRSAAASVVLPGPSGSPSSTSVTLDLEAGASLDWRPEPLVLAHRSDHRTRTLIRADERAAVVWREEIVLGRSGEEPGSLLQHLRVEVGTRPVLCTEVGLGPRWPGWDGPCGVGGARCLGSLLVLGPDSSRLRPLPSTADLPPGLRAAVLELEGGGLMVSALGESSRAVRCLLDDLAHDLAQASGPRGGTWVCKSGPSRAKSY